jgi:esterase/lipase
MCRKDQSHLNKIITLGTKFNWTQKSAANERKNLQPDIMQEKIPAFTKSLHEKHGEAWRDLVLKTADLMQDIADKNYLSDEDLKQINRPVLIGLADKDQMVSLEESTHVFKSLSNAAMYMLPNSKHSIESIDVKLLATIIKTFILKS